MIPSFLHQKFFFFFKSEPNKKVDFFITLLQYVKKLTKGKKMLYFDINAETIDYNQELGQLSLTNEEGVEDIKKKFLEDKSYCPMELLTQHAINETSNIYSIGVLMASLTGIAEKRLICRKDEKGNDLHFEKTFISKNAISIVKKELGISEIKADRFVYLVNRILNEDSGKRPTLEQVKFALMKINLPDNLFEFLVKIEKITWMLEKKIESLELENESSEESKKLSFELGINMLKYSLGNTKEDRMSWRLINDDAINLYDLCRNVVYKTKEDPKLYDINYFGENLNKIVNESLTPETIKITRSQGIMDKIKLFFSKTIPIMSGVELSFFGTVKEVQDMAKKSSSAVYKAPTFDLNS
jgi:hypothetical protein